MQRKIVLPYSMLQEVEQTLAAGNKIAAIKLTRAHGKAYPANEETYPNNPHRVGLKEAKEAIEHRFQPDIKHEAPCAVFGAGFKVKKFLIEVAGEGEVEMNLEEMQMRFLQELNTLGLPTVQHLLELTEYINEWQR